MAVEKRKVKLDVYQTMAYWWTLRIKAVVEELKRRELITEVKRDFIRIFDFDTIGVAGYRKIYEELTLFFEEKFKGHRRYSVRSYPTPKGGHYDLMQKLSEIMGVEVPKTALTLEGLNVETAITTQVGDEPMMVKKIDRYEEPEIRVSQVFYANAVIRNGERPVRNNDDEPKA